MLSCNIETFDALGGEIIISKVANQNPKFWNTCHCCIKGKTHLDLASGISGLCNSKQGKQPCITREQMGMVIFSVDFHG